MSSGGVEKVGASAEETPLVEIRGLARSFETGGGTVKVLENLDLDIAQGDRIAIVGQSGVGPHRHREFRAGRV